MPLVLQNPKLLWRRYLLAIMLVVTMLATSHLASRWATEGGTESASVINVSGRQRMLSQRILYLGGEHRSTGAAAADLAAAVDLFERSHRALVEGGRLGLTRRGAAERAPVYRASTADGSLDAMTRAFIRDARLVIAGGDEAGPAWTRMQTVGSGALLSRLDAAVHTFETQARARTTRAEAVATWSLVAAIVLVLLEAMLIFWPAQRTVERAVDEMREALDTATAAERRMAAALGEAEAARTETERAMRARTQFLANMSHELRTPLNGIMGMLEMLRGGRLDATERGRIDLAHASADHLLQVLNDILDLSRIESGKLTFERIPCAPGRCAQDIVSLLSSKAKEKGLTVTLDEEGVPSWVLADPTRLRQVLTNLVGNAIKFTDAGGVAIRLRHQEGRLRCEVADTGVGIGQEAQARLFERFEQADASTTRRFGGTGLGLSICKQLVEMMGGSIGVRSRPGEGSTFWFEMPAAPSAAPTAEEDTVASLPPNLNLLIAEDNVVNQQVAVAFLRKLGCATTVAPNGEAALRLVQREAFDAVLMDVQMPVMDGVAATQAIRALDHPIADVPIIAVTANVLAEDRDRCLAAGADAFVSKPIKPSKLAAALNEALAVKRLEQTASRATNGPGRGRVPHLASVG